MTAPFRIRRLDATDSTNADARKAAAAGEAEGLVIWAIKQAAGRGRHGRAWESPEGNLHVSILLRPDCNTRRAGHHVFIAALAVYDTVRTFLPQAGITLKWPNDILAGGKKISGILLESAPPENGRIGWLVVGVGINVEHHPQDALYPTTSLRAQGGASIALQDVLDRLLERFFHWKTTLEKQGFAPIRALWLERAQKGRLSVRPPGETAEGTFAGLDDDGHLVLQLADGSKKAIAAGDVFFSVQGLSDASRD